MTGAKSLAKSTGECAPASGKRGRNEAGSAARGSEGQNKKLKGKQIAPEEQEENVTLLKKLSSINGLESSSVPLSLSFLGVFLKSAIIVADLARRTDQTLA
jgi:hypothetical protein